MTKAGDRILASALKALAYAQGEDVPGFRITIPDIVDAARIRTKQGLSQEKFAAKYGFPLATLRDWEQKRRIPDRAAQILLIAIDKDPEIIHQAAVAGGFVKAIKVTSSPVGKGLPNMRGKNEAVGKAASATHIKRSRGTPVRLPSKRGAKRIEA